MIWSQLPLGPVQANAYIISNDHNEALVVDPGAEAERLISHIKDKGLHPIAVLLTHAHFDHIGAVDAVRDYWRIPVYLHSSEKDWPADPQKNGSTFFPAAGRGITARAADELIEGEGDLSIGPFSFQVYETPGHSPGSVSLYNRENGIVFSGDALFAGSIGRTDLPGGDHDQLLQSIKDKLLSLPTETIIAPGHGPETTVGDEKRSNPFLLGV